MSFIPSPCKSSLPACISSLNLPLVTLGLTSYECVYTFDASIHSGYGLRVTVFVITRNPQPAESMFKIFLPDNQYLMNLASHQIRYIEALQNYAKIGYINSTGQLIERTERATLKSILNEVEGSPIVKCHRSFLVNREAIISTSGNAQGLLLTLSDCDKTIPVSRSYVPAFRRK